MLAQFHLSGDMVNNVPAFDDNIDLRIKKTSTEICLNISIVQGREVHQNCAIVMIDMDSVKLSRPCSQWAGIKKTLNPF